ncbi:class 1 fructose-bisphosphatase [Methanoregula sp.]|uniref:class 1 fructose-bisphosphatase n=1 Tax=Methanoregula sp. TaxID=2052170 RepID=UPI003BB09A51
MMLSEFLAKEGTEQKLAGLILFLSKQAGVVKKGFFSTCMNTGACGTRNMFGEDQKPLDKYADEVFIHALQESRLVRYIATEEQDQVIEISGAQNDFGVVIDPLDGSSLLDVNLCVGSIIGIYPGHVLEKGKKMIAALYILFGPTTLLVFTTGHGVHEFVRCENGEFALRHENLKIPEGKIHSPGALRKDYLAPHARWIECLEGDGYKLRFSGCFVADVHQILHKGGVFTYPGSKGKEAGKLRLLYEANPMGMIVCEAGGAVSDGHKDYREIKPKTIGQVTPLYIGGRKEIAKIETCMKEG